MNAHQGYELAYKIQKQIRGWRTPEDMVTALGIELYEFDLKNLKGMYSSAGRHCRASFFMDKGLQWVFCTVLRAVFSGISCAVLWMIFLFLSSRDIGIVVDMVQQGQEFVVVEEDISRFHRRCIRCGIGMIGIRLVNGPVQIAMEGIGTSGSGKGSGNGGNLLHILTHDEKGSEIIPLDVLWEQGLEIIDMVFDMLIDCNDILDHRLFWDSEFYVMSSKKSEPLLIKEICHPLYASLVIFECFTDGIIVL